MTEAALEIGETTGETTGVTAAGTIGIGSDTVAIGTTDITIATTVSEVGGDLEAGAEEARHHLEAEATDSEAGEEAVSAADRHHEVGAVSAEILLGEGRHHQIPVALDLRHLMGGLQWVAQ